MTVQVEAVADPAALSARVVDLVADAAVVVVDMAPWLEVARPVLAAPTVVVAQELVGLAPGDPRRLRNRAAAAFGRPVEQVVAPEVDDPFLRHDPSWFDDALGELGGVDVAILTLGSNGRVAGIEPGTPLDAPTHRVRRSAATVRESAVPVAWAVTIGLSTVLGARRVVLVSPGPQVEAALRATVSGPVSTAVPATALRAHPDLHLLSLGTSTHTSCG